MTFCFNILLIVIALHSMLASATSTLIFSHRSLVFRSPAAQRANGGVILRAPGFTPRASPHLGVATLRAQPISRSMISTLLYLCDLASFFHNVCAYASRDGRLSPADGNVGEPKRVAARQVAMKWCRPLTLRCRCSTVHLERRG